MKAELEKAEKVRKEGKWPEAVELIDKILADLEEDRELAEAYRIKGWSYYYMGIKGSEEQKQANLQKSVDSFETALEWARDALGAKTIRISALNGLPLALWVLGQKEEALITNIAALSESFDDPSVWNTTAILMKWAKRPEVSVSVCQNVFNAAFSRSDERTAGNAKQNQGDALRELNRTEEARTAYKLALTFYEAFEKITGESAKFHIESVKKKLAELQ